MFCILHVSDVHFGAPDPRSEQQRITNRLIEVAHSDGRKPNVCIFSGDLAHSGGEDQFREGEAWLRRLLAPWPDADLIVVPGNHDAERPKAQPDLFRSVNNNLPIYDQWRLNITAHCAHLEHFFQWHSTAAGSLPIKSEWDDPLASIYKNDSGEYPVRMLCLNSAILSCDNEDEGKLVIDVRAINEFLRDNSSSDNLLLAVSHHPVSSLAQWNKTDVESLLSHETGVHIFLHGHRHNQSTEFYNNSFGQRLAVIGAGAAYQGSEWAQFFAFHDIDFRARELRSKVYAYERDQKDWFYDPRRSRPISVRLPTGGSRSSRSPNRRQIRARISLPETFHENLRRLQNAEDARAVVGKDTIFIVIGTTLFAELFDRPLANLLRARIEQQSLNSSYGRVFIITDKAWLDDDNDWIRSNPVISIGGPCANDLSARLEKLEPENWEHDLKKYFDGTDDLAVRLFTRPDGGPRGAVWGPNAVRTKEAVERYLADSDGLPSILSKIWMGQLTDD